MVDTEIQALIRQEVQRQLKAEQSTSDIGSFTADEYDLQAAAANIYPGKGWSFVAVLNIGINVVILWKKSRVDVARDGEQAIMPNVKATR